MSVFGRVIKRLKRDSRQRRTETEPAAAYDLWAQTYDDQPANLMLYLDEIIFSKLLSKVDWHNKTVVDIGCGTGRHWGRILTKKPAQLIGFDVSAQMLKQLHRKYPQARTCLLQDNALKQLQTASADALVSTLTLAHIEDLKSALKEWDRVLKPEADIVLTDYHPAAFEKGADRTFRHSDKTIEIKNFLYPITQLRLWTSLLDWQEMEFIEYRIDDSVKHFYERENALHIFRRFYNIPIIYGWRLKKA